MFIKIFEADFLGEIVVLTRKEDVLSIPPGTKCGVPGVYILPPVQCDAVWLDGYLASGWQIITPEIEREIQRRMAMRPPS